MQRGRNDTGNGLLSAPTHLNLGHQTEVASLQQGGAAHRQLVVVLLEPVLRGVLHHPGIVLDAEQEVGLLRRRGAEPLVLAAPAVEITRHLPVRRAGHDALLVQQRQDAGVPAVDEVEDILVVRKGDPLPPDALEKEERLRRGIFTENITKLRPHLAVVLFLFKLEDVLVELLL